MVTIPNLLEIVEASATDELVVDTGSGTRRITRVNNMLRRFEVTELAAANINLATDRIAFWDGTDSLFKSIGFFQAIFGNFAAVDALDDFTLDPAIHNGRPIELRGTFTLGQITLDGNTTNIEGATFFLNNFTPGDIDIVLANGITLFVNGVSETTATIRENTSATIQVNNAGSEAIFSGG